ncbi:MAG: TetR/AcrR family transcriptional regulator [Defluviitaleaceae bacterium]|nr:TetR/AcrR family transcriptional regulator [Defluviitaleaceae bacterium]MCL2835230.1 TetR/AcrR family transcriptional regulator [Defluviitaleaceae bacterium]
MKEAVIIPRNKYPEETVKKILDESLKLFLEKGYEQTTVLDIIGNLGGLTRGAFYHHFKSKDDVLEALLVKLFQEVNPFEKVKHEHGLNGLDKIKMVFKYSVVRGFADEKKAVIDKLALPLLSSPRFLAEQVKSTQEVSLMLQTLIEEGMADGSIRPGNAKAISEVTMLLFNIWMIPTVYPCDAQEANAKISVIKQILDTLGVPIIDGDLLEGFEDLAALDYS